MNDKLYRLFDNISEDELEELDISDIDVHTSFRRNKRILSSVMGRLSGVKIREKKSRLSKKVFIISIAAATLAAGSVGVYSGYQLSQGIYDGIQYSLPYSITQEEAAVLSEVTTPFDGTVIKNSYDNIDFEFEGIVSDTIEKHIILTASRSDGKKFSAKKGTSYMALVNVIYSYKADFSNSNGYQFCDIRNLFNITVTKNGELAIDIPITDDALEKVDVKYRFKIENIYQLPGQGISQKLSVIYGDLFDSYYQQNSLLDPETEYKKYKSALNDYALKTYEGCFEFSCQFPEDDGVIKLYDEKTKLHVAISSLSFEITGPGLNSCINRDGVTVTYKDGTSETYFIDHVSQLDFSVTPKIIQKFQRPVDPYLITEISVCGKTVKVPLYQSYAY